ncbi:ABC transporter ATP-binding protein [Martelella alba]|uniref:ABC transporter ATP-binding protein n=1 Tax=Martelella alba TaxID=2590451 RepID=A0A506UD11_9HYPH|nr:ABC transporter ATP-binding protein [Martelella alba]TPW32333.1 ABC transporter ATP-binding protein [Martelella alba]
MDTGNTVGLYPVMKRVFSENAREHFWGYSFSTLCLMAVAGCTAFSAWIMQTVVDEIFANQRGDLVALVCFSVFLAFTIRGFATYGQSVVLNMIGNNIIARYQRKVFDHLMNLSLTYYSEERSAKLIAQLNQNIGGIRDMMNLVITSAARDALSVIALVGVMIAKDPMLTLIIFVAAPPVVISLRSISRKMRKVSRETVEIGSRTFAAMQESVQGIAVVKAFTMEDLLRDKVGKLIDRSENRNNRAAKLSQRTVPLTETFAGGAIAAVIAYAGYRTIYHAVPPGSFFAFITAVLMAYDPAKRLAKLQVQLERAAINASMLYEVLDTIPHQPDDEDAGPLVVGKAEIRLDDVVFGYGRTEILKSVNFVAEGGKTTALVGPSGAGKSTIISLIPRFYDIRSGRITIDGTDLDRVTKHSLRSQIAYVSQRPYLFEGSIADNIRYGRPDASDEDVREAARLAYAHDFILAQPQGYDTPVGESGSTLSGGQQQRISIARAILRNAPILLLDEATSALDAESEAFVQKALDEAMRGRTVIVVAHRLSTVINADKIIVMHEGQVVEEGTHRQLIAKPGGLYAHLSELQFNAGSKTAPKND